MAHRRREKPVGGSIIPIAAKEIRFSDVGVPNYNTFDAHRVTSDYLDSHTAFQLKRTFVVDRKILY